MSIEYWANCQELPGYQVSNLGRVKSFRGTKPKLVKVVLCKNNYMGVTYFSKEGSIHRSLHRLMALAFIPNPENKKVVNHIDGNKLNNSLDNLEWVTPGENANHAIEKELYKYGCSNRKPNLTDEQVKEVKSLLNQGLTQKAIAEMYGVNRTTIWRVKDGSYRKRYQELKAKYDC